MLPYKRCPRKEGSNSFKRVDLSSCLIDSRTPHQISIISLSNNHYLIYNSLFPLLNTQHLNIKGLMGIRYLSDIYVKKWEMGKQIK